jgi:flavin-dependent dehydrogenase
VAKFSADIMSSQTIAIIGAGPAGSTLAALLAEQKIPVVVFDDEKRPDLLVGESLVPAVIPILRTLGIEDRVAAISMHKPGTSFIHREGLEMHFNFHVVEGVLPTYAYNVPRPQFDDLIRERARELGARFVKCRARLKAQPGDEKNELVLDDASLDAAGLNALPVLIVDAAGRARISARALGIATKTGSRGDQAHFAHYENFDHPFPEGQVVITYHEFGWSWRIPLVNRMSFGVVMCADHADRWGTSAGERLACILAEEPRLAPNSQRARRVTDVFSYTNYQLISDRGHGHGWVAIGDSFGFVDPMLSPGVFLAMESAVSVAATVARQGLNDSTRVCRGLEKNEREMRGWITAWQEMIDYFYDGRIASFYVEGNEMLRKHPGRFSNFMERNIGRRIACMASGGTTRSIWNRKFLAHSIKWLTTQSQSAKYAVPGS